MKLLLSLLLLFPLYLIAQDATDAQGKIHYKIETINGNKFVFKFISSPSDVSSENVEEVELYRKSKKLLTHTLKDKSGDSNSLTVEVGNYVINDTILIFYSYWGKVGDAPASPCGVRKQVFNIAPNGRVAMTGSLIYLDAGHMMATYDGYKGLIFLDSVPRTTQDKKLLDEYKQTIKQEYNADFVKDKEQEAALFKEVRTTLAKEIKKATEGWDELSRIWSWSCY